MKVSRLHKRGAFNHKQIQKVTGRSVFHIQIVLPSLLLAMSTKDIGYSLRMQYLKVIVIKIS